MELGGLEIYSLFFTVDEGNSFASSGHFDDHFLKLCFGALELRLSLDVFQTEGDVDLGKIADSLLV
jgi:hypothetical protein